MKILLTRMQGLNENDAKLFKAKGYETSEVPVVAVTERPWREATQKQLEEAKWLFFTSQTVVSLILPHVSRPVKIAVIGAKTADKVREAGFKVDFISPFPSKKGFLDAWVLNYPEAATIFYPKSQLADSFFSDHLPSRYKIHEVTCYDNVLPANALKAVTGFLEANQEVGIYLTSPSAWYRVREIVGGQQVTLIAIGQTTLTAIESTGFKGILLEDFLK